jgi:hypothetical protein
MKFTAAIDISTFIWCEQDYNTNRNQYYNLLKMVPTIYEKIKEIKLSILLRGELYNSIMIEFPYNMAKEISYDFERLTLNFLTETFLNWTHYIDNGDNTIGTIPEIIKHHFSNNIEIETQSQICHMFHDGDNPKHKFITYSYFFNADKNLILTRNELSTEIETLIYDSEDDIIQFFEKYKLKFDHNPKHTDQVRYANGETISPFRCFHQPNGQAKAQKLLEEAFLCGNNYYNFDIENSVYVKFVLTIGLVYHGFDLSDDDNNVPNEVKRKFNKNGRVF